MKRRAVPAGRHAIPAPASPLRAPFGHIDRYGFLPSVRAWLFWGWSPIEWEPGALAADAVTIRYPDETILPRRVRTVFFERPDLDGRGRGVCLLVPARRRPIDAPRLREVVVVLPPGNQDGAVSLLPIDEIEVLDEAALRQRAREAIEHGIGFSDAAALLSLIGEPPPERKLAAEAERAFRRGHIDYYGLSTNGATMLFCGWVPAPWQADRLRPGQVKLTYERGCSMGEAEALAYHRTDIGAAGVGLVLCLQKTEPRLGPLVWIDIETKGLPTRLFPTETVEQLDGQPIVERIGAIIAAQQPSKPRARLAAALAGRTQYEDGPPVPSLPAPSERATPHEIEPRAYGHIDYFGYVTAADAWLFCGWGPREWSRAGIGETRASLKFLRGTLIGSPRSLFYERSDLDSAASGILFSVSAPQVSLGSLISVELELPDGPTTLYPSANAERLAGQEIARRGRLIAEAASSEHGRGQVLSLLTNRGYAGHETLSELSDPVFFAIDQAVVCPPDGLLVLGWLLAGPDVVDCITIHSGGRSNEIVLDRSLRMMRRDVSDSIGREHGIADPRCGFIAYLPGALTKGATTFAEIRTHRGEIGFANLPSFRLRGMEAIRHILNTFASRHGEIIPVFDDVIGPAVASIVADHVAERAAIVTHHFGEGPAQPRVSVIVPLYGRIDYLEYQIALLSDDPAVRGHEYIYVLDDPDRRDETIQLAESAWHRFGVPFTVIVLSRNVGFAPANNIGLAHARGDYVCFLNSDVFPRRDGWLDALADRLEADPTIGTVAPLLTFEDGTIQQAGMSYERLPEFGGWFFARHDRKGMRPGGSQDAVRRMAVTGACMVMRRAVAVTLGGFDESFAIGDFEDSDLCLRLRQAGLDCVVDAGVRLDHLERKSQSSAAEPWRMNLTLYNAWLHDKRWGARIAAGEFDVSADEPLTGGEAQAASRRSIKRPDKRRVLAPLTRHATADLL